MKRLITQVMIAITLIAMLAGMCSCYTQHTAQRKIDKAYHKYPLITATFCADKYAPTDSTSMVKEYIPGANVVHTDTVIEVQVSTDTVIVTKFITKKVATTDTLRDTKYVVQENKAAITLLQSDNRKQGEENLLLITSRRTWRNAALVAWGLLAMVALWRILGTYLKLKNI